MQFTNDTPILYYNPTIKTKWSDRPFIYPLWMYRIVAPRTTNRKLNILEKAILGLCNAGVQSADEMGEYLEIHKDLAAHIISELSDRKLLEDYSIPTTQAKKLLQDEFSITEESVAGYIFQDVWTSELIPRFIETEERADSRLNAAGFPELNLGSVGNPKYQSLFMPNVTNTVLQVPDTRDILKAIRTQSKMLQNTSNQEDLDSDRHDEPSNTSQFQSLSRISFIEEQPTAVWLTTFVYMPEDFTDDTDWQVYDPFSSGNSIWLRKAINRQLENANFRELHKRILTMVESNSKKQSAFHGSIQFLNTLAKERVQFKLTVAISSWQEFYEGLIKMERKLVEIEESVDSSQDRDLIETCLIQCQKVGEQLFKNLQPKYPSSQEWQLLSDNDKTHNRSFINALAKHIGFTVPLPHSLTDVRKGKIRNAAEYGDASLRPHILAALLTARIFPDHPFYELARSNPDILSKLDRLAMLRDESSHASSRASPEIDLDEVNLCIDTIYRLLASILNLPYANH